MKVIMNDINVYMEEEDSITIECFEHTPSLLKGIRFAYSEKVEKGQPIWMIQEGVLIVIVSKEDKDNIQYRYLKHMEPVANTSSKNQNQEKVTKFLEIVNQTVKKNR